MEKTPNELSNEEEIIELRRKFNQEVKAILYENRVSNSKKSQKIVELKLKNLKSIQQIIYKDYDPKKPNWAKSKSFWSWVMLWIRYLIYICIGY